MRSFNQMSLGRVVVNDYGLNDLGFQGHPFTWINGKSGIEHIQCRFDRALTT